MKRSQLNRLSAERQKNSRPWRRVTKIDAQNVIMRGKKSTSGWNVLQFNAGGGVGGVGV